MRMRITLDNEYKAILVTRKYPPIPQFSPRYLVSIIKDFSMVEDDIELCSMWYSVYLRKKVPKLKSP